MYDHSKTYHEIGTLRICQIGTTYKLEQQLLTPEKHIIL